MSDRLFKLFVLRTKQTLPELVNRVEICLVKMGTHERLNHFSCVFWTGNLSRCIVRQWTGRHQLRQTRNFGKIFGAFLQLRGSLLRVLLEQVNRHHELQDTLTQQSQHGELAAVLESIIENCVHLERAWRRHCWRTDCEKVMPNTQTTDCKAQPKELGRNFMGKQDLRPLLYNQFHPPNIKLLSIDKHSHCV